MVVARHGTDIDAVLRVVFWSGAAMAATGLVLGLATNGFFGDRAVTAINDLPLVERVNKEAYLRSGFLALTNWHQDPGYAALWTNTWMLVSVFAWLRGAVKAPRWVGPAVVGGLMSASILTYSRTGWLGLAVAVAVLVAVHLRSEQRRQALGLLAVSAVVAAALVGFQVAVDPPQVGGDVVTALEFRITNLTNLGVIDLGEEGVVDPNLVVPDNRVAVWREYGKRFVANPIRGIGLGTGWAEPGLQEPHNLWLQLLGETGVVGLAGFLFLLSRLGRRGGVVAGSVLTVVGVAALAQTVLFEPVLWFGLGLWAAEGARQAGDTDS